MSSPPAEDAAAPHPTPLPLFWRLLAVLLTLTVRLLVVTLRVQIHGPDPHDGGPQIFAFHHGRQLGLLRYPRPQRTCVLASLSRDGSLQARVLDRLGFEVIRGSSSRGGAEGMMALIRSVRSGASAAIAVDGPRGPAGHVEAGAVYLASAARRPIVPISFAASWAITLRRTWDRFIVPLPWSRVVVVRGEPIELERRARPEAIEPARQQLQGELERTTAEAERMARSGKRRGECLV